MNNVEPEDIPELTWRAAISFGAFGVLTILLVFAMAIAADRLMTP